jgi:hypothetical protein
LDEPTAPDWADVVLETLPVGEAEPFGGPADWAYEIFRVASTPVAVQVLLAMRQLLVPLIGVSRRDARETFVVVDVVGDEALIVARDRHLDFRCGVGVDVDARLLRVTTAVWFHGWRGRVYFVPVRLLHDPVTRSMMRRAIRHALQDGSALTRA